ncbi:MAG: rhodanese-related sulfurtransferase [Sphingobium sp.]
MNATHPPVCIAALYKFTAFQDCNAIRNDLATLCRTLAVKGILLIAPEGINGTIAGSDEAVGEVLTHIRGLPGCAALDVKVSRADTTPFHRMKVQVRREIVTMGLPGIDPAAASGQYVAPEDWNALISEPGMILIDTRNDYEVQIGTFTGAINPNIATFRDFPAWFDAERERLLTAGISPKVAMFCTGGIRCEKSTAFLKGEGVDEVYHLQGGILKYLETVPAEQSLWEGECFVFDQRVAVGHGLAPGTHTSCHGCRRPLSVEDRASVLFQEGVSCPACHAERTDAQRATYAERHRQECLAKARGDLHLGRPLQRVTS